MIRFLRAFVQSPGGVLCHPDPLPPDDGQHPPTPAREKNRLVCEHCECQLTPTGDVLRMSDTARDHNRQKETIGKRDERIAQLEAELRDVRAKLNEVTAGAAKNGFDLSL